MESNFSFLFSYLLLFYSVIYVLVDSSCFILKWTKKYVLKKIIFNIWGICEKYILLYIFPIFKYFCYFVIIFSSYFY